MSIKHSTRLRVVDEREWVGAKHKKKEAVVKKLKKAPWVLPMNIDVEAAKKRKNACSKEFLKTGNILDLWGIDPEHLDGVLIEGKLDE